jgi:hypothetical protein
MQSSKYLSLTVQAIYVAITGLQLIFIPATLVGLFGFDPPLEIWIKVLGIIVLGLSIMYITINKSGNREVVMSTIIFRVFVALGFLLLVLIGQVRSSLLLFAGIDVATAIWSWLELKKQE